MSNIAGIYKNDTTAAPGISVSIYLSGCDFHCEGCHNSEAWDFNYGKECTPEHISEIVDALRANGVDRKLSLLGGEPLHPNNIKTAKAIIAACKAKYNNVEVYVWTGYEMSDLYKRAESEKEVAWILDNVKCIIAGQFDINKRDVTLPLRGSSNQTINYIEASDMSSPRGGCE